MTRKKEIPGNQKTTARETTKVKRKKKTETSVIAETNLLLRKTNGRRGHFLRVAGAIRATIRATATRFARTLTGACYRRRVVPTSRSKPGWPTKPANCCQIFVFRKRYERFGSQIKGSVICSPCIKWVEFVRVRWQLMGTKLPRRLTKKFIKSQRYGLTDWEQHHSELQSERDRRRLWGCYRRGVGVWLEVYLVER